MYIDQSQAEFGVNECFENKTLETFPISRKRRETLLPNIARVKVYCYCPSIYDGENMVECGGACGEWYHKHCITTPIHRNKNWFCKNGA